MEQVLGDQPAPLAAVVAALEPRPAADILAGQLDLDLVMLDLSRTRSSDSSESPPGPTDRLKDRAAIGSLRDSGRRTRRAYGTSRPPSSISLRSPRSNRAVRNADGGSTTSIHGEVPS